jgi:hypothetical protein
MSNKIIINLENHRTQGSKVFTGRDRGLKVRKDSNINELEKKYEIIEVEIPDDIRSINPSFLEEFLNDVVLKLGKDSFNHKFKFKTSGRYDMKPDLEEAIESILREQNALS